MTMHIDNATAQALSSNPAGTTPQDEPETGMWHGAPVSVAVQPNDILTDAAEEITFAIAEHAETHKLEERDLEEELPLELPPIESILAYLESAGRDAPEERLKQFVDTLKRNAQQGRAPISPREESRRQFGTVTEQFLALSFAADQLTREGGYDAVLDEVRTALEDQHDDFGRHIRADLNTVNTAAGFGRGDPARIDAFQTSYRDAVLGHSDLAGMLKGALERFGDSDYRSTVQHLIRALGDDLAATRGSSVEPARLHAVLQDLYLMEVLATMLDGCQALAQKMSSEHALPAPAAGNLLQDAVAVSGERWNNAGRFGAIADKYAAHAPAPRIAFLSGMKTMVRNMPIKVFADPDARSNVLEAAQGALDAAVALEEESE
jgi:type III secretion protein W